MAGTCGYGEELSGSINAENFLTSYKVYSLASQEGLCSMEYGSMEVRLSCPRVRQLYCFRKPAPAGTPRDSSQAVDTNKKENTI